MCLPAKLLSEITGCDRLHTERPDQEYRKSPRIPFPVRAAIAPLTEAGLGPSTAVRLRDISATGIGFLHAHGMPTGEQFVVAVPRKNKSPVCIHCSVVCCRQMALNMFLIGAEFIGTVGVNQTPRHGASKSAQATLGR